MLQPSEGRVCIQKLFRIMFQKRLYMIKCANLLSVEKLYIDHNSLINFEKKQKGTLSSTISLKLCHDFELINICWQ